MRIVSTLASGTEIVHALGLDEALIGISHECDYPHALMGRPRVSRPRFDPEGLDSAGVDAAVRRAMSEHGSVYQLDAPLLDSLDPDLILAQAVCEVCAVPTLGVRQVVEARDLDAEVLSLDAHTLQDVMELILAVGRAAGAEARARRLVADLRERLDAVGRAVAGAGAPSVLAIEWLAPPFEPGHWVPEMVTAAGGDCLAGRAGEPSRQTEWSELAGLDPDVLVIMPCGYGLDASQRDADAHADRLREIAPRAISQGHAWIVDASAYFNRSGPRVVDGVEILAGILHPDRCAAPLSDRARVWGG